jgi:hypothetical protein
VTPAASVTGSIGETGYSMALTDRPRTAATTMPMAVPTAASSERLAEDETEDPSRGAARGGKQN